MYGSPNTSSGIPHLLADPRRPAVDGQRQHAPRPPDLPHRPRRSAGNPGRRRAADRSLHAAGARADGRRRRPSRARRTPAARGADPGRSRGRDRHGRRPGARSPGRGTGRGSARLHVARRHARAQDGGADSGRRLGRRDARGRGRADDRRDQRVRRQHRPRLPDRRRHPRCRGGVGRARQDGRQGRRRRQADLPVDLWLATNRGGSRRRASTRPSRRWRGPISADNSRPSRAGSPRAAIESPSPSRRPARRARTRRLT